MNKIIFVIIVVLLGSCNTSKTTLDIDYVDINEDIFIRLNSEKDKVISIDYPIGIIFKNVKNQNLSFSSIDHWDFDNKSLKASLLYSKYYNSLKRISKEKYKK